MNDEKIIKRIKEQYPYYSKEKQKEYAKLLMSVDERLYQNVEEWVNDNSLSEIWIRGKYCVRAVMQIRQDDDFVDAVLALNEYAKKASNEYMIWRQRA
ncbi:MAG: hypothetical protein J1E81_02410 [Eubacterium sp.]|nr:hypothetical protein [Eubacterium sp.]